MGSEEVRAGFVEWIGAFLLIFGTLIKNGNGERIKKKLRNNF
jgi:hypothetical protein